MNDPQLFEMMSSELTAAVLSDKCDEFGFRDQAMAARIRPLDPSKVLVGRAMPVLTTDVFETPADPYKMEIASVDALKPNDVMVTCTNESSRTCFWGEILSTAAIARGARGAVIDGYTRDARQILELGFPTFVTGMKVPDSKGRSAVVDFNCPVRCGDVLVHPGDIIFGDIDGVVVIPKDHEDAIITAALEKLKKESQTIQELRKGSMLADVYAKYGVL